MAKHQLEGNIGLVLIVDNKNFKKKFDEIAQSFGFESIYGGWFKESKECIMVLELMKSNFGNYYKVNIKIYVQGLFGNFYSKNKKLVRKLIGNSFRGEPKEFESAFDLENSLADEERNTRLMSFFRDFVLPFSQEALTHIGLIRLAQENQIVASPTVISELKKMDSNSKQS